jgi:hypothetical protein
METNNEGLRLYLAHMMPCVGKVHTSAGKVVAHPEMHPDTLKKCLEFLRGTSKLSREELIEIITKYFPLAARDLGHSAMIHGTSDKWSAEAALVFINEHGGDTPTQSGTISKVVNNLEVHFEPDSQETCKKETLRAINVLFLPISAFRVGMKVLAHCEVVTMIEQPPALSLS